MKITDIEVNESIELGDNFDIELGNTIIESRIVGFMDDGVVLEADDKALALLGISGALLESVDITEVSLGDYSKKAQISRALAQIDQKFYPDKPGSEQTIAKRTRGLERAKVRNDQARAKYAAQARQARADDIAKDRENLPTLEKYLAQLQSEFDPYYEYSDDHSVWTKNRELKAKISDLERRIKDAKGITESKSFGPENPYEVKPGEDFSLVFKPGKRSGVHYHMNSGMVADPFYFKLNGKLYSVTNQGDGIPKEVQQGVKEQQNVAEVASRESVSIDMFDRRKTPADLLLKYLENQGFEEISYKSVMKPFQKDVYRFVSPAGRKLKAEYGYTGWNLQGPALNDINFDDVAKLFKTDIYSDGKLIASGKDNSDEQAMAEGISIIDQDSDLDQEVFTLNVDGNKVSFTYWDYETNFQHPDIKDIYQQAKEQLGKKLSPEQIKDVARTVFKSFEQGVAEGIDNIGNKIKALYQKIYDQGDDSIDYMYHTSPVFAQIWDEYEGDLDSIIAEVDPSELQVIANELEAYLQGPGLTEVYAPAVGGKDFDRYTPAVDAAMKKHNAEKALYKAANPKDDPTGALQQKGFDRAQAVGQRLATRQALGKIKVDESINEGTWDKIKDFGQAMGHIGGELKRTMTTPSTSNTGQKFGKGQATPGGPLGPIARYQNRNKNEGVAEGMFGLSAKEKGGIQHITSKISDIPGNWDHQAQTFTERGLEQLKTVLSNNPQYIKYALNLTAGDYDADLDEAKYQGREVPLGKPMAGDVKKSKVYVRGPKGNVVKVNFGDKKMRIKKSNPKRRKSFRARHNCANPGPRWKARYWSCRAW